jgi:hypothetical protein
MQFSSQKSEPENNKPDIETAIAEDLCSQIPTAQRYLKSQLQNLPPSFIYVSYKKEFRKYDKLIFVEDLIFQIFLRPGESQLISGLAQL